MSQPQDWCNCIDCQDRERPCQGDCDRDDECKGCREMRLEREEAEFESKQALGQF